MLIPNAPDLTILSNFGFRREDGSFCETDVRLVVTVVARDAWRPFFFSLEVVPICLPRPWIFRYKVTE